MFTKFFKEISRYDIKIAGGKGASLGEMTQAGIPVPPGFVILASAFEKFLEETDLNVEIDSILHSVNHKKIHTVENASERIKALILNAKISSDIALEIKKAFKKLNAKFVAVRSSATAEDSKTAAWAGQLETYLNTTEKKLIENVRKCWASLFTPRAIFYRFEKNLHKQKISVAVVVQKMIQSEVSGVAFSVHPVTQDRNQLIIEAVFGLGEALVSGQITPDSYVIEKKDWRILDKNIANQTKALEGSREGSDWKEIKGTKSKKQKISDKEIIDLAKLIVKIENHFGFPVDVEWVKEKGKFYIVQSRPITTLTQKKGEPQFTRIFKRFFTRAVPLVLIEYWHKGEYEELKKILHGATHFNPLFIRDSQGRINVYYDINNDDTALHPLINFVLKNPKEFYRLADEYECIHDQFLKLIKKTDLRNLQKDFDLLIGLWGFMPVLVQIGELKDSALDKKLVKRASDLRTISQEKDAQAEEFFKAVVKKYYPKRYEFLDVLRLSEIISGLFPDTKELKKRQKGFIFFEQNLILGQSRKEFEKSLDIKLDDNLQVIGERIDSKLKAEDSGIKMINKQSREQRKIIKGSVASNGYAKGRVKIIFSKRELADFKSGQILVTEMTSPEYVPIMKKSAAIITDEGGINSHAAIVSRELKKPCVIGTKIATQVLKDGDLVEVDANRGVVRILKRFQ